ncbi:hypothetical protein AAMO2058_001386800 [Amorphochlora amoebiformis]
MRRDLLRRGGRRSRSGSRGRTGPENPANIQVAVRVRPALPREIENGVFNGCLGCLKKRVFITLSDRPVLIGKDGEIISGDVRQYDYDHVFSENPNPNPNLSPIPNRKTFTMLGSAKESGVIYLAANAFFERIRASIQVPTGLPEDAKTPTLSVSYVQIYKKKLTDLLSKSGKEGETITPTTSLKHLREILKQGDSRRKTAATNPTLTPTQMLSQP